MSLIVHEYKIKLGRSNRNQRVARQFFTVVRSTSQSYKNSNFFFWGGGVRTPKPLNRLTKDLSKLQLASFRALTTARRPIVCGRAARPHNYRLRAVACSRGPRTVRSFGRLLVRPSKSSTCELLTGKNQSIK